MILPIEVYGASVLRGETLEVQEMTPELEALIANMIETMHQASGIGLAAPQVGRLERLFIVDLGPMAEEMAEDGIELPPQPMVFINPEIIEESDVEVDYEEGCLSIPDIRETVYRPEWIRITYLDRNFEPQELMADDMLARVIQHEYDHLEGILFVDHISAFRRRLLRRRLREMSNGKVEADYILALGESNQPA